MGWPRQVRKCAHESCSVAGAKKICAASITARRPRPMPVIVLWPLGMIEDLQLAGCARAAANRFGQMLLGIVSFQLISRARRPCDGASNLQKVGCLRSGSRRRK